MGTSEKFCLRWDSRWETFTRIRDYSQFFDCTLTTDDDEAYSVNLRAHKVILSACSEFFGNILTKDSMCAHPNPLIYIRGISTRDMQNLLHFIYNGEVNIAREEVDHFLEVAETPKIKGLTKGPIGTLVKHLEKDNKHLNVTPSSSLTIGGESYSKIEISSSAPIVIEDSEESDKEDYGEDFEDEIKEVIDEQTNVPIEYESSDCEARETPKATVSEIRPPVPIPIGNSEEKDVTIKMSFEAEIKEGIDEPTSIPEEDEHGNGEARETPKATVALPYTKIPGTKPTQYKCKFCPYESKINNAMRHFRFKHSNNRDYECATCGMKFKSEPNMRRHFKFKHSDRRDYVCTSCGKAFKSEYNLKKHVKCKHGGNKENSGTDKKNGHEFEAKIKEGIGEPTNVPEEDESSEINKPTNVPEGDESSDGEARETTKATVSRPYKKIPGTKPTQYQCNFCPHKSKIGNALRHFRLKHSNNRDYECVICAMRFKSGPNMRRHLKFKHTDHYYCVNCGKAFKETLSLTKHMKCKHGGNNEKGSSDKKNLE